MKVYNIHKIKPFWFYNRTVLVTGIQPCNNSFVVNRTFLSTFLFEWFFIGSYLSVTVTFKDVNHRHRKRLIICFSKIRRVIINFQKFHNEL